MLSIWRSLSERQREVAFGTALLASLAFAGLAGELAIRLLSVGEANGDRIDWTDFTQKVAGDPDGTNRLVPGAQHRHLTINEHGFRGDPIAAPKPAGTVRIAFFGDSKLLNAHLDAPDTIVGKTLASQSANDPGCRYEPIWASGPGYQVSLLTEIADTVVAPLEPDAFVILVGSRRDALAAYEAATDRVGTYLLDPSPAKRYSALWRKLADTHHLLREDRREARGEDAPLELDAVAAAYGAELLALAERAGSRPVVMIGYRSRLRPGQDAEAQLRYTRHTRVGTMSLSVQDIVALDERLVAMTESIAAQHGFAFIDPIARIPDDAAHFLDDTHLTHEGAAIVAQDLASALAPLVRCPSNGA